MEFELKYRLRSEQAFQQLLGATALGAFRLEPGERLRVHDRYVDTESRTLLKAGYACRLRRESDLSSRQQSDRHLATVKGLGDAGGAFHRRLEYEIELPEPLLPLDWPPSSARDLVLEHCGERPLLSLFDIKQERHRGHLYDQDRPVAELSLDRVSYCDGQEKMGSSLELEAELLPGGKRQDLDRLAAELDGRPDLVPQPHSKFEQGLALLDAASRPEGREKPRQPTIHPDDAMSEAGREILRYHFQEMVYHEPGTRLGEDADALHDMRVATRRMRAAFRVFGDYFDPQAVAPYLKGLKRTGRALGPVRDLDVLQIKTRAYLDALPEPEREGLQSLLAAMEQRREVARQQMLRYLDSDKYARFKEGFHQFVHTPGMGSLPTAPGDGKPRPYRLRHIAPTAVYERLGAVRAYDEWVRVPDPPLERLHALRIACKRLRYTLEFFEQVLGPGTRAAIKQVVAVQDHLGALQDCVVASGILREFLATGSWGEGAAGKVSTPSQASDPIIASGPGVEAYLAAREAEMRDLVEDFSQVWQQITSPDFGRMVADAVGVL